MDGSERGEWIRSIGLHSETNRTWGRINSNSIPHNGTHSFGFAHLFDISVLAWTCRSCSSRASGEHAGEFIQVNDSGITHTAYCHRVRGFANPYDLYPQAGFNLEMRVQHQ